MPDAGPFAVEPLIELMGLMLQAAGAAADEAQLVAARVVDAEARESRSQGLIRIPAYVNWARQGKIASGAPLTTERDQGSVLVLDAHNGWGHIAAIRAMDLCLARAAQTGTCLAVIRRTNHIGRLEMAGVCIAAELWEEISTLARSLNIDHPLFGAHSIDRSR